MQTRPRFTLERELGHGGEGRVVAVRDAARAGAVVALKETHGVTGQALLREFELLATLRHRHLAEVYEYFPKSPLGGQRAAYTQMFVPGDDLYRTLRAEPGLADVLIGQLLLALAQLHAAGLVHLDLKPDNVLVEAAAAGSLPRARLVDFGIAARVGSRPDIVRGSRSYVAPEILAGEPVAPSADLFALGIALAEISLGSPVAARQVASEGLATRRVRLASAGMSGPLSQLTAALLALDPGERPKTAYEAAHLWGTLRNTSLELVTPASATGLVRSGGLVARGDEKARVLAAIARCEVVTIGGPPASGRTALMESALRAAQRVGHAAEAWPLVSATASVEGFVEALGRLVPGADALDLGAASEDISSPERWAASLELAAEAAVTSLSRLASVGAAPVMFVRHPQAAPASVRAFLRVLRRQSQPLRGALRAAEALPLAFVIGDQLDADIMLGPVGADAVRAFITSRFGDRVASDSTLVSALASASGGLTGHLEALLELLVARRTLTLGEGGWTLTGNPLALTTDLREAIASRVTLLEPAERAVLIALATLSPGHALPAIAVEAVIGEPLGTLLDDLVAFGLVRRDADGAVALGHPVLAEVLPVMPIGSEAQARALCCERLPETVQARLEGGVAGASRALRAAREALAGSRPEDAQVACMLASELARAATAPALELEGLSLRAEIADRLGPREAQLAALEALIAGLGEGASPADPRVDPRVDPQVDPRRLSAEARLFWTLTRMGDPSFEARGEALVVRARDAGEPLLAAEVAVHLAIVATQRGEQDRAEALLLSARAGLDAGPTTLALRARISNNLGNVYAYRGDFSGASAAYREARRLKVEEGDPVGERIALGNIALMSLELGEPARALDDLAQSYALARRIGHRRGEAWSLLTLAEVGLEGASPRYARRRAEAAAKLAQTLGDQLVESDARTTLAEALLALGDAAAALVEAERGGALAQAAQNQWTASRAKALANIARARLAPDGEERTAIEAELAAVVEDASADATTRQLAARHVAEAALARGETARAHALIVSLGANRQGSAAAADGAGKPRGGVRWAELLATRLATLRAVGAPEASTEAKAAQRQLAAWVAAWPEAAIADGVDDAALTEGPCRRSVVGHATVMALLAGRGARDMAYRVAPEPLGEASVPRREEANLVDDTTALANAPQTVPPDIASLTVAELERRLTASLVDVVRALDAERAFLVRPGDGAAGSLTVIDARDADGEPVADAKRRLPDAAIEAVLRGLPWRAPGPEMRGAIASVPWTVLVGGREISGAVVLQNRFISDAFIDSQRSAEAVADLRLVLRLRLLEAAIDEARANVQAATQEVEAVQARTTEEVRSLRRELESTREQLGPVRDYAEIVFASSAMKKMLRQVDRVIATDLPVHVHGESGTGKELIARAIHHLGGRARGPFVPQNCTAIPPTLFESELFGHERGAFTGAMRSNEGLFRRAHQGTLFLDEIGDLPLELQAKLLRVLETGEVRPVGATRSISVDVRIVSATHRDLTELIKKGTFREDLFYRLNVIRIDVPALRDRPEDIPALVQHFLVRRSARGASELKVEEAAMKALVRFGWPGNVRQLENEIARASLLADGGLIKASDLSPELSSGRRNDATAKAAGGERAGTLDALGLTHGHLKDRVDRLEALALTAALREADGNKSEVARVLGLSRAGLNLKLKRLGLWEGAD